MVCGSGWLARDGKPEATPPVFRGLFRPAATAQCEPYHLIQAGWTGPLRGFE